MIPDTSLKLLKHKVLVERLPEHHPQYSHIYQKWRQFESGQAGEANLEYYLQQANLDSPQFLNGLRIEHKSAFQIDWILFDLGYRVILEIKNYTAPIYFDPHSRQLIRTKAGEKEGFPDPLLQVDLQHAQLRRFLDEHNIEQLPTFTIAVFVNRKAILHLQDYPERRRILTAQAIPSFLEKIARKHPAKISSAQNQEIVSFLRDHHQEAHFPILERFGIEWRDIIKGVPCPRCGRFAMNRIRLRWQCPHCDERSTDAHLHTLFELALLSENRITKRMAREFLGELSPDAARKIMQRAGFVKVGTSKGAYYRHPDLAPFI
ncbi:Nuclease-related domain-containing protein [Gracilibacillus orientalis]|uniref:Nuclease-related domain-containing protein n=1 Tax=Gracilibacillus orientalis TaxID=334253 RepID=A0A1I4P8Q8_9BACI|nr:nuclease-related domain-containing protein [Gracilibacillus orientalis]SFM24099.1 Nuclease-related domain-containing protein [Gracilibacillus orientalis]